MYVYCWRALANPRKVGSGTCAPGLVMLIASPCQLKFPCEARTGSLR